MSDISQWIFKLLTYLTIPYFAWHIVGRYLLIIFPGGSMVKNLPVNAGDTGVIPRLGRFPGEGNGNRLQ